MDTTIPIVIACTAFVLLGMGAILDDRRARHRRVRERVQPPFGLPLLHSLNDDRCIGCEACIDVCPTEVLDLVDHKVRVARFSDCVQCEQCANVCPTQALVMYREGTTPRMLTVPELDEHFQTAVPGQYLIGEVAGKPLVKNAANLGRAVVEHIARELAARPARDRGGDVPEVVDVVIVGSGPGGLSAGLACVKHRLSCVVLEKEHFISSTVARYPKGKHFMAEPGSAHNVSYLPVFDGTKEQLVAAWTQVIEGVRLPLKLGEAVETVRRGDDGVFTIKTTVASYRARTVVLATGLRGKPRLLAVPGANLEKVQSLLDDPAEFAGEDVLVVGGGDSAVEGAMALAEVGARVTLSYRGDGFKRCKQGNQKRLAELVAGQRLAVLLESSVTCFAPDSVTLALAGGSETTIANQRAFVLIGAETPVAWLEANHVRFVERPHLYALGSTEDVVRRYAPDATPCPATPAEALAVLQDRPRSSAHRMRAVVDHLRDELREVVTSVSSVFRLSELERSRDARRASTRTPTRGSGAVRPSAKPIPASRLAAGRPATEPTVIITGLFDTDFTTAQDAAPLAPLRPHTPRPRAPAAPAPSSFARDTRTFAVRPLRTLPPDAAPSLRVVERQVVTNTGPTLRVLERQAVTDTGPTLRVLERKAVTTPGPSLRAVERDGTTDAMSSLRVLERDGTTDAMPSLRALERELDPDTASTLRVLERDGTTDAMPSLRALERGLDPDTAATVRVLERDGTTDAMPSLRALERDGTTEAIPSLRTRERAARPAIGDTDEMAVLRRELDAPTDEMASLRTRERGAMHADAGPSTERLPVVTPPDDDAGDPDDADELDASTVVARLSLPARAPRPAIAPGPLRPRRAPADSDSVMTSATRPPALAMRSPPAPPARPTPPPPVRLARSTPPPPPMPRVPPPPPAPRTTPPVSGTADPERVRVRR